MADSSRDDPRISLAKAADIQTVAEKAGAKLKRAGAHELVGPCIMCGGDDRFSINTRDRVYNCRGSGGG